MADDITNIGDQALQPTDQTATEAEASRPVIPGTNMPLPTPDQRGVRAFEPAKDTSGLPKPAAPEAGEETSTDWDQVATGFVQDLIKKNTIRQAQLQKPQGPGFGDRLRQGGFGAKLGSALGTILDAGGDKDYASYRERIRKERAENQEIALKQKREEREEQDSEQRRLMNNIQMGVHQKELQKLDIELQDAAYTRANAQVDRMEESGLTVQRGVTLEQLNQMEDSYPKTDEQGGKQHFLTDYTVIESGSTEVNGKKVPTFSVVKNTADPYKLQPGDIAFIKENGGPDLSGTADGTVPMDKYVAYSRQAAIVAARKDQHEKATNEKLEQSQLNILHTAMASKELGDAFALHPNDPIQGVMEALYGDPKNPKGHPGLVNSINMAQRALNAVKANRNANPDLVRQDEAKLNELISQKDNLESYLKFGPKDPIVKEYIENHRKIQEDAQKAAHEERMEQLKLMQIEAQTGTPEGLATTGRNIAELDLGVDALSKRASMYNQQILAADKYMMDNFGVHFNERKAKADFEYAKNISTQNTLKLLNSLTGPDGKGGNLGSILSLSDKVGRTDFPSLNALIEWGRKNVGNTDITNYVTAVTEVSDQVAKILQGGGSGNGTSDAKLREAKSLFDSSFSVDQIKGVADTLKDLLYNRKNSMVGDNVYLRKNYGTPEQQANPWNLPRKGGSTAAQSANPSTDGAAKKPLIVGKTDDQIEADPKTGKPLSRWVGGQKIFKMKDGSFSNAYGAPVDQNGKLLTPGPMSTGTVARP